MAAFSVVALLPDADVVAFALRIPYEAPFGHRGASHSVCAAVLVAALAWPLAVRLRLPVARTVAFTFAVALSHPLLDTLTTGGLGCALLWPWSPARFFAPLRPIPVAPIGLGMLSARGAWVALVEVALFSPCWLFALWPRGPGRPRN